MGTSYVSHRAPCRMKTWGSCFQIRHFNMGLVERVTTPCALRLRATSPALAALPGPRQAGPWQTPW